jgi:hypothetical protein
MKDTWFFWLVFFYWSDHFDQGLSCKSNRKGQIKKMVHQDAHGLVKSAILNGHAYSNWPY